MADMFSRKQRSEIMSKVRSRENKATELRLIRIFRDFQIRGWRRRSPVFGHPDFVFPSAHLSVFVDGCFWHGCPQHCVMPVSNRQFWERKITRNKLRDRLVGRELKKSGWQILRIWQHELSSPQRVARRVERSLIRCRQSKSRGAR
jgi:DNA mismatch endonuclease, patch repair protein